MTQKFKIKSTGREITFGDLITCKVHARFDFGDVSYIVETVLDKDNVKDFLKDGVIEEAPQQTFILDFSLGDLLGFIAKKKNVGVKAVITAFDIVNSVNKHSILVALLSASSMYLNEVVKTPKSDKVYLLLNGEPSVMARDEWDDTFPPAFNSIEEAMYVRDHIVKAQMQSIYGEQED